MDKKEKSLKLAELMGWKLKERKIAGLMVVHEIVNDEPLRFHKAFLEPYDFDVNGLAQFAAILLKFPGVMWDWEKEPTQANILDAVLRMEGASGI